MDILIENKDISHLSNFKTKAKAKYYFEINSTEELNDLKKVFVYIQENKLQYLIIAEGTNLLLAFDVYDGVVIKNNLKGWSYTAENHILEAYSSELISSIAEVLEKDDNQDIWHRFIGLPGSVGGAVYGNAGCFGLETENNFKEAYVMDITTGDLRFLSKDEMKFEYRSSLLKKEKKYFLIKAIFDLSVTIEKYSSDVDNIEFREVRQPKGNTCGSFFKNPSKEYSAGRLIEEVGLKGYKHKTAFFSPLHANFLMCEDSGEYKDLLELITLAQRKVKEKFNIDIVPEVQIITNS